MRDRVRLRPTLAQRSVASHRGWRRGHPARAGRSTWAKWLRRSQVGNARTRSRGPSTTRPPDRTACANVMAPVHTCAMAAASAVTKRSTSNPGSFRQRSVSLRLENKPARPEAAATRRERTKLEANDNAAVGKAWQIDSPADVPHEQRQVEILGVELGGAPPLTPLAEPLQDLTELLRRARRLVLPTPAAGQRPALDDARLLELAQPLGEQRPRDARDALTDLVEPPCAGQQLSQDQGRPALGEGLARHGDGAELSVSRHSGPTLGVARRPWQVQFLGLAAVRRAWHRVAVRAGPSRGGQEG